MVLVLQQRMRQWELLSIEREFKIDSPSITVAACGEVQGQIIASYELLPSVMPVRSMCHPVSCEALCLGILNRRCFNTPFGLHLLLWEPAPGPPQPEHQNL